MKNINKKQGKALSYNKKGIVGKKKNQIEYLKMKNI